MTKEELYEYFTSDNLSGKKCNEKWISKNNRSLYNSIINWCNNTIISNVEFKRKVFHYINELLEIPTCLTCGGDVKYKRIADGYSQYCSNKCSKTSEKYYNNWRKTWKENNSNGKSIEKRMQTLKERYGSDFINVIKDNRKKSMLNKYGVENSFQIESVKQKRRSTLKGKYGNESFNNPDKTKKTRIKNKTQIDDSFVNDFIAYKIIVVNRTHTIYRNNIEKINPNNLKRGKKNYHIDHIYSIKQGYINNIPISIITHPCNLHLIDYKENLLKQDSCWITIDILLTNIINYEEDININHSILKEEYKNIKDIANNLLNTIL